MSGRIVAFDLGDKRIGVAVSDPEARLALPRETIARSGESWPWRTLLEIVAEAEAVGIVVGDPLHMDGRVSERSRISRAFAEEIGARTGLPVALQDERLTSVQAERSLREGRGEAEGKNRSGGGGGKGGRAARSGSGGKGKAMDVARSASLIILQAWLDTRAARRDDAP